MHPDTIHRLNAINRAFYATTAKDFDQTRAQAWAGWHALTPHLNRLTPTPPDAPLHVLDVGCGNGRFAAFLSDSVPRPWAYHGQDNSPELLAFARHALADLPRVSVTLETRDIVQTPPDAGAYDVVVLFGVIHHIPGGRNRQDFMRALGQRVRPGGLLVFAAWRFLDAPRLAKRITPWESYSAALAQSVEAHDYLLDWRRGENALRYCHYVDDAEHAALIRATGCTEIESYSADGENAALNRYSVLQRPPTPF